MGAGRPSKLNSKMAEKIVQLFRDGKTEQQVADIVGVHVRTIENWRRLNVEFLWATNEAKQFADEMVEAALFSRATGYSHPETKVFMHEGCTVTEEVEKHYPPDTQAAKFWLTNRRATRWKDKTEVEHGVSNELAERMAKARGRITKKDEESE